MPIKRPASKSGHAAKKTVPAKEKELPGQDMFDVEGVMNFMRVPHELE